MTNNTLALFITVTAIVLCLVGLNLVNRRDKERNEVGRETSMASTEETQTRKLPVECSEEVMSQKAHGTCVAPVQDNLRE